MALPTNLGTESIGRLLRQYAVPAIVAMTASSLYNMIDSIFIGQGVGPLAISGLAVTFPFMNLAAAFGALVGVGASTIVSVKLGQKDYASARKALGNVVALNIIIGVMFMVVSLLFLDKILLFFGASENTLQYAREYMESCVHASAYTYEDVMNIAHHQVQQLTELFEGISKGCRKDVIFFDTELIITKVWFLHKYGTCPEFLEDALHKYPMDIYLLCCIYASICIFGKLC